MPILIPLIIVAAAVGGGVLWWKYGHQPTSRQITLDAGLPDADKQSIIAAIMTEKNPANLDSLAARYGNYPWASWELRYRAWELRGSQGPAPAQPVTPGQATPAPIAPAPPPPSVTPGQVAQAAQQQVVPAPGPAPAPSPAPTPMQPPPPPPAVISPIPAGYDLIAAASKSGAWGTDSNLIKVYQTVLTFLALRANRPAWNPQGIDGKYGPHTQAAVIAFQKDAGQTADGKVGAQTATQMVHAVVAALQMPAMQTGGTLAQQAAGVALAAMGGTHAGMDPMASYAPYTTERQEEMAGASRLTIEGGPFRDRTGVSEGVAGSGKVEILGGPFRDRTGMSEGVGAAAIGAAAGAAPVPATKGEISDYAQQAGQRPPGSQAPYADDMATVPPGGEMTGQGAGGRASVAEHMVGAGLAAAAVQAAAGMPVGMPGVSRPPGGWYLNIRPSDRIWPRKIVEIGSGIHRGSAGALRHLVDINPHLAPGGVIRQLVGGDEVNVPESWVKHLRAKGLDVLVDSAADRVMTGVGAGG